MKWELIGKETILIGESKFSVGSKWLPPIRESACLSRKLKANNLLISSNIAAGCIVDDDEFLQVCISDPEHLSLPLLAVNYIGNKNCLYFAKVSDEYFWVVSFDSDGCIDISDDSDSIKELHSLRDYVREVVELSYSTEDFNIVNIGEIAYLDDPILDSRVIHKPISQEDVELFVSSKFRVKKQAGNLKTKIYSLALIAVGGVGFGAYSLITSLPQEIIDIRDGEYSIEFTGQYNKYKQQFNKIVSSDKKSQYIDLDRVLTLAKEEFNDYVLSRGLSNHDVIQNVLDIRFHLPFSMSGWKRYSVQYKDDKFIVTYKRKGDYPISSTFLEFDRNVIGYMLEQGYVLAPVSLANRGEERIFDITVPRTQKKEYSTYVSKKRSILDDKAMIMTKLRQDQQKLDDVKRNMEGVEASVYDLGVFERRDSDTLNSITGKIKELKKTSQPFLINMQKMVETYEKIQEVEPPKHEDKLLGEMGIEQELFPIFQSTNKYEWSNPSVSHTFPSGITDEKFKDYVVIKGSVIEIDINDGVMGMDSIKELVSKPYAFVDGIDVIEADGKPKVKLFISINELNQEFIY